MNWGFGTAGLGGGGGGCDSRNRGFGTAGTENLGQQAWWIWDSRHGRFEHGGFGIAGMEDLDSRRGGVGTA